MSLTELVNIIEEHGKGVRAYSECARACRVRLKSHSDQATAYFLLSIAADKFVDTYDDQPLTSQRAEDEFLNFKNYADQLLSAEQDTDTSARLNSLNRVATQIANHQLHRSAV